MPTAARLAAALAFAAVAFFAAESFVFELPEGTNPGMFSKISAALGAFSGWTQMGRLAGGGYFSAATMGIRTLGVMLFYIFVTFCLYEMITFSMKLRYEGPGDAVIGFFDLVMEYGYLMITSVEVMSVLLVGSVLGALLTEWVNARAS